jgi:serine/threonine protein kinase
MASAHILRTQHPNCGFWTKPKSPFPKTSGILHSGFLHTYQGGSFYPRFYVLARSRLLEIQWWSETEIRFLEGNVEWATVESFEERQGKRRRYGFTVKTGDWAQDFYVAECNDLEEWLKKLGQVAILTNLKEDYDIKGEIGRGGQSIAYLGLDKSTGTKVAIKCYSKQQLTQRPKRLVSLVREITILRSISHPIITKLLSVYESDSSVWLITDYCEGESLSRSLSAPFKESEALRFMVNLTTVLEYLGSKHVIHRDIKPENIILTDHFDRAQFKLIDFGLARRYEGTSLCDMSGSPGYFAPEVLTQHKHGPKVDIYAAGVLFYTLIEGANPFCGDSLAEIIRRNKDNDICFNSPVWRGISPTVVSIIRVMSNPNPEQRMYAHDLHTWLLRTSGLKPSSRRGSTILVQSCDNRESMGCSTKARRFSLAKS